MKQVLLLAALITFYLSGKAQLNYYKTFSFDSYDRSYASCKTNDGCHVLYGISYGQYHISINLIKINDFGDTLWTKKIIEGSKSLAFGSIIQTNDGGFFIASTCNYSNLSSGFNALYAVKTDSSGNVLWTKIIELPISSYFPNCAVQTSDGSYVIIINDYFFESHMYIVKLDPYGNFLWYKNVGSSVLEYYKEGNNIITTNDGGFVITGFSHYASSQLGSCCYDPFIIKLDSLGNGILV